MELSNDLIVTCALGPCVVLSNAAWLVLTVDPSLRSLYPSRLFDLCMNRQLNDYHFPSYKSPQDLVQDSV